MEVLSSTSIKQSFRVPLSCKMCKVTAKTRNVPGNVTSPQMTIRHPFRPSTATNKGLFLPPVAAQLPWNTWPQLSKCCLYRQTGFISFLIPLQAPPGHYNRGAHILGTTLPRLLHFAQLYLIFMSPQYGIFFMAPYWHIKYWGVSQIWKFTYRWTKSHST